MQKPPDVKWNTARLWLPGTANGPFPEQLAVDIEKMRSIGITKLPRHVMLLPVGDQQVLHRGALAVEGHGGDGWLRSLRFVPSENKIHVQTYSPVLDKYNSDAQEAFSLDYEMPASPTGS